MLDVEQKLRKPVLAIEFFKLSLLYNTEAIVKFPHYLFLAQTLTCPTSTFSLPSCLSFYNGLNWNSSGA